MNLITNASESLGEDTGLIGIVTDTMDCDKEYLHDASLGEELPEGKYVYFQVSDTGCGMDADTLAKIFDPFFTTKFTGRGLGLAAVIGITRAHKGAIKISSAPGRGTTFRILFPCSDQPVETTKSEKNQSKEWSGSGTVLLVDDEEVVRQVAASMLKSLGFDVLEATDGQEAVEIFRKHKNEITLVLLDLTMPRMSGEETFDEIRKIIPDACIMLSSGYTEQDAVNRFEGKGLAGFVQKPYKYEELKKKISATLNG
jgi:CheY-like chemotaxis protein